MSCSESYTIIADQGADVTIPVQVSGLGQDVTISSAIMQLRETLNSDVYLELSSTNGKILIVGSLLTISISNTETAEMNKRYMYDLFITTSDSRHIKILHGAVVPVPSVTR